MAKTKTKAEKEAETKAKAKADATAKAPEKKVPEKKAPKEIWVKRNKLNLVTINFKNEMKLMVFPGITRITEESHPGIIACIEDGAKNKAGIAQNHAWVAFLENKTHELVTGKASGSKKKTSVFTAMDPDGALAIIKETYSIPALEQMANDESHKKARQSVLDAIGAQIEYMKDPDAGKD